MPTRIEKSLTSMINGLGECIEYFAGTKDARAGSAGVEPTFKQRTTFSERKQAVEEIRRSLPDKVRELLVCYPLFTSNH